MTVTGPTIREAVGSKIAAIALRSRIARSTGARTSHRVALIRPGADGMAVARLFRDRKNVKRMHSVIKAKVEDRLTT